MFRPSRRHLLVDLAVALLVIFVAVSLVDIRDYDAHSQATLAPFDFSRAPDLPHDISPAAEDPGDDTGHVCACLLCVTTIPHTPGPLVRAPSAGKLPPPLSAGVLGSPHPSEVFHPPSA